jgi:hypothetical protein
VPEDTPTATTTTATTQRDPCPIHPKRSRLWYGVCDVCSASLTSMEKRGQTTPPADGTKRHRALMMVAPKWLEDRPVCRAIRAQLDGDVAGETAPADPLLADEIIDTDNPAAAVVALVEANEAEQDGDGYDAAPVDLLTIENDNDCDDAAPVTLRQIVDAQRTKKAAEAPDLEAQLQEAEMLERAARRTVHTVRQQILARGMADELEGDQRGDIAAAVADALARELEVSDQAGEALTGLLLGHALVFVGKLLGDLRHYQAHGDLPLRRVG